MQRVALIVAGALLPLSLAPFFLWPATFVGLGLAFWLIREVTNWRHGALYGWLIGVGKYALGASWIYVSIHEQGGASEALAGILVGVFVAGMALFSALFGALYGLLNRGGSLIFQALLFTAAWVLAEWSLTWLLTGFPWLFAGYGLMPTWLLGYAPVMGVLGLGALGCLLSALLVGALPPVGPSRLSLPGVGLVWGLVFVGGYGLERLTWVALAEPAEVALVQGNIEQLSKWDPANRLPIIERYENLTAPHWDADLVIWPEAAITLFAEQAGDWLNRWDTAGRRSGSTLVLGLPDRVRQGGEQPAFQNTAVALGEGSGRYVKRRLVPFGEYVPLEGLLRGLIRFFDLPMSRSTAGPWTQPPLLAGPHRLGLAICYEIAYPELVRSSAANADVLITISNDAWFGGSIGPHQHLQIAQMRAVENARYVLRATNNGLTAVIDERGQLRSELPQFVPAVLASEFRAARGRTPFNRLGHWPVLGLALLVVLVGVARRMRRASTE